MSDEIKQPPCKGSIEVNLTVCEIKHKFAFNKFYLISYPSLVEGGEGAGVGQEEVERQRRAWHPPPPPPTVKHSQGGAVLRTGSRVGEVGGGEGVGYRPAR